MIAFVMYDDTGRIDHAGMAPKVEEVPAKAGSSALAGTIAFLQAAGVLIVPEHRGDLDVTHYVDLAGGKAVLTPYTGAELAAKLAMPRGWTWVLPERVARDLRNATVRARDEDLDVQGARYRAYPPLTDLADALYWQAKGDSAPMTAYIAAVAKVKADHPKKGGK